MEDRTPRVAPLVEALTREEKLGLVHGAADPEGESTGYVPGVERLDIPPLRLVDGPLGVRTEHQPATAFPASIALAASFDPSLARELGGALARETRARDQDVLLAPGTNIVRVPQCGRNFEYYSEDPVVASRFAAASVEGIQDEGVVATAKHYVANNQEENRCAVSAEVDERTLRELYLRPFEAAVDAEVGAIMTAYNRVDGTYMSDHDWLVGDVLKDEWAFHGLVMSDWYGTASTVGAANAGLDLEMPGVPALDLMGGPENLPEGVDADAFDVDPDDLPSGVPDLTRGYLFADALGEAVDDGEVPEERLDDMVARVLGTMDRFGMLDGVSERDAEAHEGRYAPHERTEGAIDTPEHRDLAQRLATRGTVLLENDGVLPLSDDADLALVGPHVGAARLGGGGSSEVTPFTSTSPEAGVTERAGGAVTVEGGIEPIEDLSLFDLLPFAGNPEADGDVTDGDEPAAEPDLDAAVEAAADADAAVVFVRDSATEALDRESLALPGRQDELVEAVADANDRTVVVVQSSGPVELPWREDVAAVLEAWYPGQAAGDALAAVLYGDADPGGRLPVTFAPEGTYPTADERRYPGVDGEAHYEEGLSVGYRHFDGADVDPTYPFGHGHSYAAFEYGDVTVEDVGTVRVTVENVADRPGFEVVQAYVRPPEVEGVERPERELAGFAAVELDPGEERAVTLGLDSQAVGRYDPDDGWTIDAGSYTVEVGRSAGDVRTETTVEH